MVKMQKSAITHNSIMAKNPYECLTVHKLTDILEKFVKRREIRQHF